MTPKPRPRKPISAARIELRYWFADEQAYRAFYDVPLGRKSQSVADREWILPPLIYPDGHIEATYRFTHTCRNDGAQRGDSEKFFRAVCKAAGLDDSVAKLLDVHLINREKFAEEGSTSEPVVEIADTTEDPPAKVDDLDEQVSFDPWSIVDPETRYRVEYDYYLYGVSPAR